MRRSLVGVVMFLVVLVASLLGATAFAGYAREGECRTWAKSVSVDCGFPGTSSFYTEQVESVQWVDGSGADVIFVFWAKVKTNTQVNASVTANLTKAISASGGISSSFEVEGYRATTFKKLEIHEWMRTQRNPYVGRPDGYTQVFVLPHNDNWRTLFNINFK